MEDFERLHRAQLQAIGFPARLLPRLFSKLTRSKAEDLDNAFQLAPIGNGNELKCCRRLGAQEDVYVLRHVCSSDGGEGGREALLSNLPLLEELATSLGVPLPWERRKAAMEQMMETVCQQTGKSKVVARKALTETGYDLVGAILHATDLSEEDVIAQRGGKAPSLTVEEFKRGLERLRGDEGGGELSEAQVQEMYGDWRDRKLREPVRDSEDWVQCGRYRWKEEEDGVVAVSVPVPPDTRKKDIKSVITSQRWTFVVKGGAVIEGEFWGRVVPDECFWTVEGGCVSVSVQTVGGEECAWGELILGEVQGKGVGREEMAVPVEEVIARTKKLNLFYSAVTNEGKITLHPLINVSNECCLCLGEQPKVWYLTEPFGLGLVHSRTPNFACHPFAKSVRTEGENILYITYGSDQLF